MEDNNTFLCCRLLRQLKLFMLTENIRAAGDIAVYGTVNCTEAGDSLRPVNAISHKAIVP